MEKKLIISLMRKFLFFSFIPLENTLWLATGLFRILRTRGLIRRVSFLAGFILFLFSAFSQDLISRIDIQGNKIISDATIISKIKIRAGSFYNEDFINEDVKNLYAAGFFETVEVDKEETSEGVVITFKLKEKPVLKKIIIEGAHHIRKRRIEEAIDVELGSFVDDYKLKQAKDKIEDLYSQRGFPWALVSYNMEILGENEAWVKFTIEEKEIFKSRRVNIEGNKNFSNRRILKLMKTKPAWLFNQGIFKEDVLNDDVKRVKDFYKSQGFSDAKVQSLVKREKKGLYITIKIKEGERYYIGQIKIEGNKEVSLRELERALEVKEGDVFSEEVAYKGSSNLRKVYMDKGYIFSEIKPLSHLNLETEKVDVIYMIIENEVAYVERIDIKGNTRTKDKVIRRNLKIFPSDRFDGELVRKSKERLENLGFFEEINFGTEEGSKPDQVNLAVDVKEAKTGALSLGGGYSSIDEFMGFVELSQRNFDYKNFSTFTGGGQDLSLITSVGTLSDRYQLSFTNPWIFDRPISFGFDGYKRGHVREENVGYAYEENIRGGALRLGREFGDNFKGGVAYRLERVEISDVIDTATQDLKEEAGINDLSSAEFSLSYDSRDNIFNPSSGIYFPNTVGITGGPLGGDKDFIKYFSQLSFYVPLIRKSVVEFKVRGGIINPFSSTNKVPIYERFFAGGASTIRGYHERKVGPIDQLTEDPLGGEAMFVGNIEYTYPLTDFFKLATFFDTGNVWAKKSDFLTGGFKSGVGLGLRVKTPIGPVSVDYGWPLNIEAGEEDKQGRFHFNISRGF